MNSSKIEEAQRIQEELRNAGKIHEGLQNARKVYDELTNYKNNIGRINDFEDLRRPQSAITDLQHYRSQVQRLKEFHNSLGISNNLLVKNEFLESMRSLQKMVERERNLTENSLLTDVRKSFRDINRIAEQNRRNSIYHAQKEIDYIIRNLTQNRNELDQLRKGYLNELSKWHEQLIPALSVRPNEAENIVNAIKQFKEQFDLLPRNFRKQEFWNEIDSLRNTYVGNLAISMRNAIFDSENEQEAFGKLEALVGEKLESLTQDGFSRFEFITLILGILSLLLAFYQSGLATYQFFDSQKSSQEQKQNAERIIQLLEKIVENTADEEIESIYYVIERNVSVKKQPKFKGTTIDILPVNTKVRLLKSNHKWIFIEYMDHFEIVPRYGWVNKKYLKRLDK